MTAGLELAYLGFEVSDLPGWDTLLTGVIGLAGNGDNADGSRGYRMDEFEQRLSCVPADRTTLPRAGYARDRARAAGIDITHLPGRHTDDVLSFFGRTPSAHSGAGDI